MRQDDIYPTLIGHMERQSEFQNAMSRDMGEVKATLAHVLAEAKKTNGRVTALEQFRWQFGGAIALAVPIVVAGWDWAKHKLLGS